MKGILDRFEGDKAVILIEENKTEHIVGKSELPAESDINTIFDMEKTDNEYKIISIDTAGTNQAKNKSRSLMAKLREKSSGSKFRK